MHIMLIIQGHYRYHALKQKTLYHYSFRIVSILPMSKTQYIITEVSNGARLRHLQRWQRLLILTDSYKVEHL